MTRTTAHVEGHYEATTTPWATDYVWVPGEEEVEGRLLDGVLRPWHAAYAEQGKAQRAQPGGPDRRGREGGGGGGAPPRWGPPSLARRLRRAGQRTAGPSRRTIPEGDGSPLR